MCFVVDYVGEGGVFYVVVDVGENFGDFGGGGEMIGDVVGVFVIVFWIGVIVIFVWIGGFEGC